MHHGGGPPQYSNESVTWSRISGFLKALLMDDTTFGSATEIPFMCLSPPCQGHAKPNYVAMSQKQVAYLLANAFLGNTPQGGSAPGTEFSTLTGHIHYCEKHLCKACCQASDPHHVVGYFEHQLYNILSLFASLAVELGDGTTGPLKDGQTIVYAAPQEKLPAVPLSPTTKFSPASVCYYNSKMRWLTDNSDSSMPAEWCGAPLTGDVERKWGSDFMSGHHPGEAIVDIAGSTLGGGQLCYPGMQDESLTQYYPELLPHVFFCDGLCLQPLTFLGARRYKNFVAAAPLHGSGNLDIYTPDLLNHEPVLETASFQLPSGPRSAYQQSYVLVASSDCAGEPCESNLMFRSNACGAQRGSSFGGGVSRAEQDTAVLWHALAKEFYHPDLSSGWDDVAKSVGTGPWGAGVWWGDSALNFLIAWQATSLTGKPFHYYLYNNFIENPGNQCFTLGTQSVPGANSSTCAECLQNSFSADLRQQVQHCGRVGLHDVTKRLHGTSVAQLHTRLSKVRADGSAAWSPCLRGQTCATTVFEDLFSNQFLLV